MIGGSAQRIETDLVIDKNPTLNWVCNEVLCPVF
jgi:hypothetical protein